ncbi:hypothetical protein NFB41_03525 [Yersinia ruckeri]|uniref:hypothetical protein n=1 Tax=Yersinia ruckeri TaxID=29486 RepID=UPI002237BCAC|nr:hypothetical protein [Yersinia ruckeri]MCW6583578.1 hypothetical protein [Yersinia ruckeri]
MSWQGIPFPFTPENVFSSSYFAISRIPKVVIESEFAWDMVLGSLLAGCIPAIMAWLALRNNKDMVKLQQEAEASRKIADLDAEKARREEDLKIERVKTLEALSNDFISEVEVLGAVLVKQAKTQAACEGGNGVVNQNNDSDFKFLYELSLRLNKQINSITLLIDTENPAHKDIIDCFRGLQLLIKKGVNNECSMEETNLPGMAAYVNNFLIYVRTYTDYEFKAIYKGIFK